MKADELFLLDTEPPVGASLPLSGKIQDQGNKHKWILSVPVWMDLLGKGKTIFFANNPFTLQFINDASWKKFFLEFQKELGLKSGLIITSTMEDRKNMNGIKIATATVQGRRHRETQAPRGKSAFTPPLSARFPQHAGRFRPRQRS